MALSFHCSSTRRRQAVLDNPALNGIDFVEVFDRDAEHIGGGYDRQYLLRVHFLRSLPPVELAPSNVAIEGGERIRDIRVLEVIPGPDLATGEPHQIWVVVDRAGDFSDYALRLVATAGSDSPPVGIDRILSSVTFNFKVECPSDFDCEGEVRPAQAVPAPPAIDYLAKDYGSFVRLMLDRLAVTLPGWKERNPADIGVMLVELMAGAGDELSYFQDAVGTEAYLGTARRRVSVRRHARLLDYPVHEGCNARTPVVLYATPGGAADGARLGPGTQLLTRVPRFGAGIPFEQQLEVMTSQPTVFETLHTVTLHATHNQIDFYTWGETECMLPAGATSATLRDAGLHLAKGDLLVFEEVLGVAAGGGGSAAEADPARRHVVRLLDDPVKGCDEVDPADPVDYVEIRWHAADALPFDLCLRRYAEGWASVARGNVVLADHGRSLPDPAEGGSGQAREPLPRSADGRRYRPRLPRTGVTHTVPFREGDAGRRPVADALTYEARDALPAVTLFEKDRPWRPVRDLLNSDRFAPEFVAEVESDGETFLRFGDDVQGRRPEGIAFEVAYRIGNGTAGNLGADALRHVVLDTSLAGGIADVRNPLPARGGTDPEPLDQVKLLAPHAFKKQERAVRAEDYAEIAERHPDVQRAVADLRWTGSWYSVYVTIDRREGRAVDAAFRREMRAHLERYRMAGHDVSVRPPKLVALHLAFRVVVDAEQRRSAVREAVLDVFGNGLRLDGKPGFFHPDHLTFGQSIYLSQVIAAVMNVPGVSWVDFDPACGARFQRLGDDASSGLDEGRLRFARLEIPRLDNDRNAPENGRIELIMDGGL